jgi:hypothetical protein
MGVLWYEFDFSTRHRQLMGHQGIQAKTYSAAGATAGATPWVIFIGPAVADALIVITMTFLLGRKRSAITYQSRNIVMKLIQLTVETNLLSTILALASMILFVSFKVTIYLMEPHFIRLIIFLGNKLVHMPVHMILCFSRIVLTEVPTGHSY